MSYFPVELISDNELLEHGYQPEEVVRFRTVERMALDARERGRQEKEDADRRLFDQRSQEISHRYDRLSIAQRRVYDEAQKLANPLQAWYEKACSSLAVAERSPENPPYTPRAKWWQFWKA